MDGSVRQRQGAHPVRFSSNPINQEALPRREALQQGEQVVTLGGLRQQLVGLARVDALPRHGQERRELKARDAWQNELWTMSATWSGLGELEFALEQDLLATTVSHDADGRPIERSATGEGATRVRYDVNGAPALVELPDGTMTVVVRDTAGQRTLRGIIRRAADGTPLSESTVTDLNGRGLPVEAERIGHYGEVQQTTQSWDAVGRLVLATTPEGHETRLTRNLAGWPASVKRQRSTGPPQSDADYEIASHGFDRAGRLTTVTDPSGQVSRFRYTPFGELRRQELPGIAPRAFAYDGYGRPNWEFTPSGDKIQTVFDQRGDAVELRWLDAPGELSSNLLAEWTYDDLGRVIQATDNNLELELLGFAPSDISVTRTLEWDSLDRREQESITVGLAAPLTTDSPWQLVNGEWERVLSYASGTTVVERYDDAGRLAGITGAVNVDLDWLGELYAGRSQGQLTESSTFDGLGRRLSWHYAVPGLRATPQDDPGLVARFDVVRDVSGRVVSAQSRYGHELFDENLDPLPDDAHPRRWTGYTYDPLRRLQRSWDHDGAAPWPDPSLLDNGVIGSPGAITTTIDDLGGVSAAVPWDRQREPEVGGLVKDINHVATERYHAAARNPGHQLSSVDVDATTLSVVHDETGRVVDDGRFTYVYDVRDRLVAAIDNGTVVEAYGWTDDGRIAAVLDDVSVGSRFTYDGLQLVEAWDHSDSDWSAHWGGNLDQLLAFQTDGPPLPVLTDHRHGVSSVLGPDQVPLDVLEYSSSGRLTVSTTDENVACSEEGSGGRCLTASSIPFEFASAWRSSATGLVWMRHRWYSPRLRQFVSPDPLLYVDRFNPYAYAGFDPVNRWDPMGLKANELANKENYALGNAILSQIPPVFTRRYKRRRPSWSGRSHNDAVFGLADSTEDRAADAQEEFQFRVGQIAEIEGIFLEGGAVLGAGVALGGRWARHLVPKPKPRARAAAPKPKPKKKPLPTDEELGLYTHDDGFGVWVKSRVDVEAAARVESGAAGPVITDVYRRGLPKGSGTALVSRALREVPPERGGKITISGIVNEPTLDALDAGLPASESLLGKLGARALRENGFEPGAARWTTGRNGKPGIEIDVK